MRILPPRSGSRQVLASCLLVAMLTTTCPGLGWVQAFAAPQDDLSTARDHFAFGDFSQAQALLTAQIDGGQLQGDLLRDFLELRARCFIGLGQEPMARDDFCRVHRMDMQWQPDAVNYTQNEMQVYEAGVADCEEVKAEAVVEEEGGTPFYAKPVVWAVAGAGIVAILLLGGGGDDEETVPDEPLGAIPPPPTK